MILGFTPGYIHKWKQTRLPNRNTYFVEHSAHDCSRTHGQNVTACCLWYFALTVSENHG